jgi:hypothetical protein
LRLWIIFVGLEASISVPVIVLRKYLRMFFTTVQWLSPRSDWYLLIALRAYETYGCVLIIAYMIDPIAEAYGTLLMWSSSSIVEGH